MAVSELEKNADNRISTPRELNKKLRGISFKKGLTSS
jgi:hypothetical protein